MRRDALLRYRAERLLRKDYEGVKPRVLAVVGARLRSSGASLDQADLDACYSAAWHALYAALTEGEHIEDVTAWLVLVTFRRAIDEWRASTRQRAVGEAHASIVASGLAGDIAAELDDRERLRQLMEGLVARLSPRERHAATLCYLHGCSRAQAARRMGVSEARMRKLMDGTAGKPGVAGKVGEVLRSVGASEWCEQQSSLMRAYAHDILDPDGERHTLAREHLRHCPGCRALVLALRGLAALLPPLVPPSVLSASHQGRPLMSHRRSPPLSHRRRLSMSHWRRGGRLARVDVAPRLRVPAGVTRAGGSLVPKMAVASVAVLGAGGGYALLAHGASSHARVASHATRGTSPGSPSPPGSLSPPGSPPPPPAIGNPAHSAAAHGRARARPPANRRNPRHRVAPAAGGSVRPGPRTVAGSVRAPSGSAPVSVTHAAAPSNPAQPSSGPSGEFTPEQVGARRRGG